MGLEPGIIELSNIELTEEQRAETVYNVIFAWSYLEWGGAQVYFLSIIKHAPGNWRFKVLIPENSLPEIIERFRQHDVEIEFIKSNQDNSPAIGIVQKIKRQWNRIRAERELYAHLRTVDTTNTIVHIEAAPWQSWQLLSRLAGRGHVFVTMHNALARPASRARGFAWKKRLNIVFRLKRFHLFASNVDTRDSMRRWLRPGLAEKITVTYTAIDPPEIDQVLSADLDRDALCAQHGIPTGKLIVMCVGQFIDRKGRWVFLDAAQQLAGEQDIVFVWLTPQLPGGIDQARVDAYDLRERFFLVLSASVGRERADILKFIRMADIFALPSYVEGLPIALLEAMALRVPSISTNVYAIPEAVKHLETGLLVDAGDAKALGEAVLMLSRDSGLREDLSARGRDLVVAQFDEREVSRIAIEAYQECFKDAR